MCMILLFLCSCYVISLLECKLIVGFVCGFLLLNTQVDGFDRFNMVKHLGASVHKLLMGSLILT